MSDYKFTVGEYKTRGGDTAVVRWDQSQDMADEADPYPLYGFITKNGGGKVFETWALNGKKFLESCQSLDDILPPAPKMKKAPLKDGDIDIGYEIRPVDGRWRSLITGVAKGDFWAGDAKFSLYNMFEIQQYEYRVDKNSPWQPFHKEIEDHD